jgi:hypothetical protein
MSNKEERFRELKKVPFLAGIDHRHLVNSKGQLPCLDGLSRAEKRKIKLNSQKLSKQYASILRQLNSSGAKFPTDQLLRQFAIEYTHRYASSGFSNQPLSFDFFEPFCNIKFLQNSIAPYMQLAEEFNHLFYLTDFIDYLTLIDSKNFELKSLLELPSNKTFHYTINGDLTEFSVLSPENREFFLSGFSIIRRGTSLHWYLIGGNCLMRMNGIFVPQSRLKSIFKTLQHIKSLFYATA